MDFLIVLAALVFLMVVAYRGYSVILFAPVAALDVASLGEHLHGGLGEGTLVRNSNAQHRDLVFSCAGDGGVGELAREVQRYL